MHEAARRTEIPSPAKFVLRSLAWFHNGQTGRCDPSIATIANDCGISERTVYRQISLLEHCGFIKVINRGSRSNSYILTPMEGKSCWEYKWVSEIPEDSNLTHSQVKPDTQSPLSNSHNLTHSHPPLSGCQVKPDTQSQQPDTQSIYPDTQSPNKEDKERDKESNRQKNLFSAHAHATAQEPDQTPSASPQEKKDLVSVDDGNLKKPTGIITTGTRSKQPERFDFRRQYFEQAKRMPKDRLVELMESWNEHKAGISRKGQWINMHRKLFIGAIIRMENEHGTQITCDRIESAICGGYPAVTSPEADKLANMSKRDLSDKYSCNNDLDDLPF